MPEILCKECGKNKVVIQMNSFSMPDGLCDECKEKGLDKKNIQSDR
jgi:hypothetical protein